VGCIASVFLGAPYGREAVDAAVRAESRRPATEGRLGLVHDVQEVAPNPSRRRQEELLNTNQGRFLFLFTRSNQFYGAICPGSLAAARVDGFLTTEQNIDLFLLFRRDTRQ
jgi:hypothetical protein